jgi:capsular polysaccharide biosynthesis protein
MAEDDEVLFAHELQRNWGLCEAVVLDAVQVVGSSWVQWRFARTVDGFSPGHGPKRRWRGRIRDLLQLRYSPQHVEEALWVHDDWSGNYFHWLTDVLPKLLAWQKTGEACRQVLLPRELLSKPYVNESLARLGFQGIGFNRPHLQVRRLIVIGPTAPTGNFRSSLLNELRDQLRGHGCKNSEHRLYVSRADAAKRHLVNEAQLGPILESHDIQSVQLEGRSLAEQIELFSSCRLLVGLHGAGLTNMLWMPAGGHVVEIRRRHDRHNNCYFAMASGLGHQYSYLQAEDAGATQDTHTAELHITPQLLEDCLQGASSC